MELYANPSLLGAGAANEPAIQPNRSRFWLVCAALSLLTFAVYWQVQHNDFVRYDDPLYVTENDQVQRGLTLDGVRWAFTTGHAANWHPLTWLSHMADVELFGVKPGPHHLVNVAFHAANAVLLFIFLLRTSGAFWPSALVGALFAWHPLHVESVAWIAERKDVLSTFLLLLTLLAYRRYALRPGVARYLPMAGLYGLALMSKPTVVTLPCAMLLLDLWPLRRIDGQGTINWRCAATWRRLGMLMLEKLPLLALAAGMAIATYVAQRNGRAMMFNPPLAGRVGNAAVSCVMYVYKTFVPTDLAVFYPHPGAPSTAAAVASLCLIALLTYAALRGSNTRPWFTMGWLWFVGTLIPVCGLVQVGSQAMADRYTYLPHIGLFVAIVWGGVELLGRAREYARPVVVGTLVALGGLMFGTIKQVGHWQDTLALFWHTAHATKDNWVAQGFLGLMCAEGGQKQEAERYYRHAITLVPGDPIAHYNLGNLLMDLGHYSNAIKCYRRAIEINPQNNDAYNNLALIHAHNKRYEKALTCLDMALQIAPDDADHHYNRGFILNALGRMDEARQEYQKALKFRPQYKQAASALAMLDATPILPFPDQRVTQIDVSAP